jgi:hypothetical protein
MRFDIRLCAATFKGPVRFQLAAHLSAFFRPGALKNGVATDIFNAESAKIMGGVAARPAED